MLDKLPLILMILFFFFIEFDHKISENFFWVFDESNEIISLNFKAKIAAH